MGNFVSLWDTAILYHFPLAIYYTSMSSYTHTYTYRYSSTYTHTHMYTYTYKYTCTHTYTRVCRPQIKTAMLLALYALSSRGLYQV